MKAIDYLTFKKLLHIEDDDHWLGGELPFLYRIAGGAVRAVPLGMKVDLTSKEPVRPLVRDLNYNPACFESLNGESNELELYNPSGMPDAVLLQFPASVDVVSDFLTKADLWWMVDEVLLQEYGLSESLSAQGENATTAILSHTQTRAQMLATVLNDIENRALECHCPLVRSEWPGTKTELRAFLQWYAPRLSYVLQTDDGRLTDELRPHGVTFGKPGRARDKGKKIYKALFPSYPA